MNNLHILEDISLNLKKLFQIFLTRENQITNLNGHILTSKGNKFYCDGEVCGYAMTLSTAQDLKRYFFFKCKIYYF